MKRILTAAVLAPVVLYLVLKGPPWAFYLMVATVAALCYHEYCGIARISLQEKLAGIAAGCVVLWPNTYTTLLLILFPLLAMALALRLRDLADVLPNTGLQTFGLIYIYGAWKTAFLLRAMDNGPYWLAFGLLVNWLGDSGAFYIGSKFGRHKLAPIVSPAKSWEGAAASVAVSILFGVLLLPRFTLVEWWQAALISIAANAAGQVGDLAESAIKRGAGVKDSSALLPGHGGMLDRVDSSLFSLPMLYAVLSIAGIR